MLQVHARWRELIWWVLLVSVVFLLIVTIAPESVSRFSQTWLARGSDRAVFATPRSSAGGSVTEELPSVKEAVPTAAAPDSPVKPIRSKNRPAAKSASGAAALPRISELPTAVLNSGLKIRDVTVSAVRSPRFELKGGVTKPFTPRPWVQVAVAFSTSQTYKRVAFLFELEGFAEVFSGAVAFEDVQEADELLAVAYLVPARAEQLVFENGYLDFRRYRVAAMEGGRVLGVREVGRPSTSTSDGSLDYIYGFLRPRSLTPFAPLAWDAFVPDAGFAESSDFGSSPDGSVVSRTSGGN